MHGHVHEDTIQEVTHSNLLRERIFKLILIASFFLLFLQLQFDILLKYFDYNIHSESFRQSAQDFLTLFLGITVEAFPFVVFGTLVSVIVAIDLLPKMHNRITNFNSPSPLLIKGESNNYQPSTINYVLLPYIFITNLLFRFDNLLKNNRFYSHLKISLIGFFMPVCECGNIPVARRLIMKNYTVSQAVTFLLAAPIINPITLFSTWKAFEPDLSVVIIRMLAALVIANAIGILISFKKNQNELLTDNFIEQCKHEHDHEHDESMWKKATEIFQEEFITVMKMLVIGALAASIMQVLVPRDVITSIGGNIFLSVIAMLVFAFVISICSNVDAFVVLYYANTFTIGSILTFLIFGPMIDIKILNMLSTTFKIRFLILLSLFVALSSILIGLMVNYFY